MKNDYSANCNWSEILNEVDLNYLREFANGNVTRHEFRTVHPEARRIVEHYGVDRARQLARKAVWRRTPV